MALRLSTGLRDRRLGIHTNLITNGDFTTDTDPPSGWTAVTATLTTEASGQSGNCMRVAETGGADPGKAYQDIATKVGHLYKFSGYFKKGTADNGKFMIGKTSDEDYYYDSGALTDAAWAQKTHFFVAEAATTRITCQSTDATAGEYSQFDTLVLEWKSHSIQDIFNGGEIKVYTGTQPSSPDAAPTGTLLCTFKNGASGITFADSSSGTNQIGAGETWSGVCASSGTAGWFRLQHDDDAEGLSTSECRLDGTVATSGGQINFSSTVWVAGATETITAFQLTEPSS